MTFFFSVPVCPHGGGVGLCEYIQHISIFDFICISATLENRYVVLKKKGVQYTIKISLFKLNQDNWLPSKIWLITYNPLTPKISSM